MFVTKKPFILFIDFTGTITITSHHNIIISSISKMSMQPLSPSKVLDGGDSSLWTASLVMEVQISDGFPNHDHLNQQGLKAKEGILFQELDILAEESYTGARFYIFNPQKFAPSKVKEEDLKAARKSLQE